MWGYELNNNDYMIYMTDSELQWIIKVSLKFYLKFYIAYKVFL